MDERTIRLRVGAVVVAAFFVVGTLLLLFGDLGFKRTYTIYVQPETAPGVSKNTPVRKNGIRIGQVSDVKTLDTGVLLTLRIDRDQSLFENEVCKIGTASFLGDAVIDFVPGNQPNRGNEIQDQDQLRFVSVDRNPMEILTAALKLEGKVSEALDAIPGTLESIRVAGDEVAKAGASVDRLTSSIQEIIGDQELDVEGVVGDIRNIATKVETALDNFNQLMTNVNDVVGDGDFRNRLKESLKGAPDAIQEFQLAISEARETITGFQKVTERADTNLQNLEDFTAALGSDGPELIQRLKSTAGTADEFLNQINGIAQQLATSDGTLGKFVNDPSLYNNLNETLANARDLTIRLKPLVNDLRLFADGLARDPGQIVRGAFDGRPNNGAYKPNYMR